MNETKVFIDLDNIGHNAKTIVEKYKEYKYHIAVIKSGAYGHGEYIVNELVKNGINYVAVSFIEEALKVRAYNKDIPILILEPISLSNIDKVIENNLTITIHDLSYLEKLTALKLTGKIKTHIKVDSGMNRLGIKNKDELEKACSIINEHKNLELEGIYTHFATIGLFDKNYDNQVDKFEYLIDYCELVYLDRTEGISTSKIKNDLGLQEPVNGENQIPETN